MENQTNEININDIFWSAWGYDQTNVSWYKVIKKTAKTCTLIELKSEIVKQLEFTADVMPTDEVHKHNKEPIKRVIKLNDYRDRPYFKINTYANAYQWDGKPKAETAWHCGH